MIEHKFLQELENFRFALKRHSKESGEGEHASSEKGEGMIFKDHKIYTPGDDIRRMDWKAYARTKDLYIKRFEEEKSITIHILVDRSSSMDFGENNKYDFAAKLGLALSYMASNTDDRYRYSVFSETLTQISKGRRKSELMSLLNTLNSINKTPESRIESCVSQYTEEIKHESTIIIISDFLTDLSKIKETINRLEGKNAFLINTLSEEELNPQETGDTILKDPESKTKLRTYLSKKTKSKYQKNLEHHLSEIEETCRKNNVYYSKVSTDNEPVDILQDIWREINSQ